MDNLKVGSRWRNRVSRNIVARVTGRDGDIVAYHVEPVSQFLGKYNATRVKVTVALFLEAFEPIAAAPAAPKKDDVKRIDMNPKVYAAGDEKPLPVRFSAPKKGTEKKP